MNYNDHFKIELSEVEVSNFETGYWKIEDFEVVNGYLSKVEKPAEIKLVEPSQIRLSELDCIFISYDEPNAERNWSDLLNKAPWAKRVHGVKGSDAAHKAAAELSTTSRFITVDADNVVDPKFFKIKLDFGLNPNLKDKQLSWCGKNYINNLVYGNGGLKCWTKDFVLNMQTHEAATSITSKVEFCWDKQYKQMTDLHSVSYINSSPLQAWRAGFREGVKMTLSKGLRYTNLVDAPKQLEPRNLQRLLIWCSVGSDVDNGLWAMYGARMGCYMTNCTDWDYVNVRDFDYLTNLFNTIAGNDPLEKIDYYGKELRKKLNLPITFLYPEQSKFLKTVYSNPPRHDSMDVLPNWDKLDL
jgi:hypothetical protein